MFHRARKVGPALLVPLAWGFTVAVHAETVTEHTMFVAHVVMTVLLAVFAVTGRAEMRDGLLNVWWTIIAVGFVVTLAGTVSFEVETAANVLAGGALFGWMVLPAVGFLYTARLVSEGVRVYVVGALGCFLGLAMYVGGLALTTEAAMFSGLVLVGVSQTTGILDAVLRYDIDGQ